MSAPAVKGWCPGALRPMPTGDGLLARVRVGAGRLSLDRAEALAAASLDCGNGTIEISSRANLQLRGIAEDRLSDLQARLARVGLIDADPGAERLRNVVASPLGDLDPEAALDVAPLAEALEARLVDDAGLGALPAKFGFVIDAGGRWPLGDVEADVRFEAFPAREGVRFAVRLNEEPLASTCAAQNLPDVAARLARAFLDLAGPGAEAPRRMRALVRRNDAPAVFAAAGLATETVVETTRVASPRDAIGVLALHDSVGLGAAPPFGRMQAQAFAELARAARARGASGLRLTPWRTVVVVGLDATRAISLAERLDGLGFIVARDDPRLGVVACTGAPACAHAESETLADARALAALLPGEGGIVLHVSGCAKGCARAAAAPWTLVAKPEGYDLVIDGRAGDAPAHRGLSLRQAAALCRGFAA